MRFLDREREMARLDQLAARHTAGLVALWGRRRVGKTRLLSEWCRRHGGVYTVADQSAETVQRRYFADALSAKLKGFNDAEYPDWRMLLRRLSADAAAIGWRGPLVLDEFPHWVASSASLPSVLQNWLDGEAAANGLLVAIAGSSQRMMQGLVLDASAPLYGRTVEAFALQPIPAGWIGEALDLTDPVQAVLSYAVWGGIPRYWELAAPFGEALDDAVDALALDPLGALHTEPDRLLIEETPSALSLRPLLDVIGNGSHRLSEIAGRLGTPATSLSRSLVRLQELGLIARETPFDETEKASKRALYRICDPFSAFWFRVIAPHRGLLAGASRDARRHLWKQAKPALVARAWEALCRAAASRLAGDATSSAALRTPWMAAARWWHGNAEEWDIALATVDGRRGAVGEVKWSERPFDDVAVRRIAKETRARALPPRMPEDVTRLVFVPAAGKRTARVYEGVRIVDAEAVLACLR
jgi:AAA+ ATPase superfamily predicted ATPase